MRVTILNLDNFDGRGGRIAPRGIHFGGVDAETADVPVLYQGEAIGRALVTFRAHDVQADLPAPLVQQLQRVRGSSMYPWAILRGFVHEKDGPYWPLRLKLAELVAIEVLPYPNPDQRIECA